MHGFGKTLVLFGVMLAGFGLLILAAEKIPGIGKLPGDIYVKKGNFTFYFPLATCILVSFLLTLLLNFFGKHK